MPINKLATAARMVFAPTLGHRLPRSRPGQTRPGQARPDELAIVWVHKFSKRDTRKPASKPA